MVERTKRNLGWLGCAPLALTGCARVAARATAAGPAPNPPLTFSGANISPNLAIGKGSLLDKRYDQPLALSRWIARGSKRALRSGGTRIRLRFPG